MKQIIRRLFDLKLPRGKSAFVWGPRKVGKTYWVEHNLRGVPIIDLLKSDVFATYAARPALLRERFAGHRGLLVIDEIQKVPALLDEVHWLMEHGGPSFVLTGSSATKLRRAHANLLAGRAWRRVMAPLSALEVEGFDLEEVMVSGLLPPHFLSPDPVEDLRAYFADYLKEEIAYEARVRDIPAFSEFLRVAAVTSGGLLNYVNVARESGVSHRVARSYFDILEDTYLGFRVPPWRKSKNRRMVETEKFYLFDVGVTNYLCRQKPLQGSPEFGRSFEHYILMELRAYQAYRNPEMEITFWRTAGGVEVDFVLGDREVAIEVKGAKRAHEGDTRGLAALKTDGPVKKAMVVCLEDQPRTTEGNIEILPWRLFLESLWDGELI